MRRARLSDERRQLLRVSQRITSDDAIAWLNYMAELLASDDMTAFYQAIKTTHEDCYQRTISDTRKANTVSAERDIS